MLLSRYRSFHSNLKNSRKFPLRFLANINEKDHRTVFGTTLGKMSSMCQCPLEDVTIGRIKSVPYSVPLECQEWQENMSKELMKWRVKDMEIQGFSEDEIETIFNNICVD